ncbi:hypothetical protein EalM132_00039 [Exiguobacterium phage vB_EalM-132]|nr:hypothetical protein EalM132_00039 [Exiguobacterium phage vB_EalM-132]
MAIKKKGIELLDNLFSGEKIYSTDRLNVYYIFKDRMLYFCGSTGSMSPSSLSINDFIGTDYYIESVDEEHDIRDILYKNAGKWAGKYKFLNDWIYVGVCPETNTIVASYDDSVPVANYGLLPGSYELSICVVRPAFMEEV